MPATKSGARKSAPRKPSRPKTPPKDHPTSPRPTPHAVTNEKFAPTTWGHAPNAAVIELDVPSGQTCLIRTVGIQGLIKAGILEEMDSLTAIVDEKFLRTGANGEPEIDAALLMNDQKSIISLFDTVNKVVCYCVVEPKIEPVPVVRDSSGNWVEDNNPDSRVEGVIYIDTVPEEDQMFIFNAVAGGTRDLEQFREQSQKALGGLGDVKDLEDEAE